MRVQPARELRRDLLPEELLLERRLRRGLHLAEQLERILQLLQGLPGPAHCDGGARLPAATRARACAPARTRAGARAGADPRADRPPVQPGALAARGRAMRRARRERTA